MRLTTDFECGGGHGLTELAPGHWRLEANGDATGYNKYLCVRVDEPAPLHLELHPDSRLGAAGSRFFHSHFPSHLWCCLGEWGTFFPLRHRWEDAVTFTDTHIDVRLPLTAADGLYLATNPPLRYSEVLAWAARSHARRESLGASVEGRELPVLRCGTPGRPRLLVLAGQHPSEHSGVWAACGIVDWLGSALAEARAVARQFDIAVVPLANPDGNVHGLSGANAEGVNLCSTFDREPWPHENRLLWDWLAAEFAPDVLLHFHGYMGWRRFAQHPCDGTYQFEQPELHYREPARLAAYRALQDHLEWLTPARSASDYVGPLTAQNLEWYLAREYGTLCAFYEINSASVAASEQRRRGPQVLGAVARALQQEHAG